MPTLERRPRSAREVQNLHINTWDRSIQAYRRAAIGGMKQAKEAQIQKAYAAWKKEKQSNG